MKLNELLDMTLREVLENFSIIYNPECGYYYGIAKDSDIEKIFEEYNVCEYEEAFAVENVINDEVVVDFDSDVRDYDTMVRIMNNLGISRKSES